MDYNKQSRFTILEINGVTIPVGSFGPDNTGGRGLAEPTEYQPPPTPSGAPWDHVVSWEDGYLALGVGDYAVIAGQYRLRDGHVFDSYPEVMTRTTGALFRGVLLDTKSTEPGWPQRAKAEWNDPVRMR
jgi:hypothetical protein